MQSFAKRWFFTLEENFAMESSQPTNQQLSYDFISQLIFVLVPAELPYKKRVHEFSTMRYVTSTIYIEPVIRGYHIIA